MPATLLAVRSPMVRWSLPLLVLTALVGSAGRGMRAGWRSEPPSGPAPASRVPRPSRSPASPDRPAWPEQSLTGEPAKQWLVAFLTTAAERLDRIGSYTAVLQKRERLNGAVAAEETMELKVRHGPFAVYLKYRGNKQGREVLYAEGKNGNKLVAHTGDWTSRLIPRLLLEPTGTLAMVDNRHPITEAGLGHLTHTLLAASRRDLDDASVTTVLDRVVGEGRSWLRSIQTYQRRGAERPLSRVEVRYDPATGLPLRFTGADWPESGHAGDRELAESYRYDDLRLDAGLTDLDFDSDNPAYAFARL